MKNFALPGALALALLSIASPAWAGGNLPGDKNFAAALCGGLAMLAPFAFVVFVWCATEALWLGRIARLALALVASALAYWLIESAAFAADAGAADTTTFSLGPILSLLTPLALAFLVGVIHFAVSDVSALAAKWFHVQFTAADQQAAADYLSTLAAKALAKAEGNLATVAFTDDHPVVDAIVNQALGDAPGVLAKSGWTTQRVTDETLAALGRLQAQMTTSAPAPALAPAPPAKAA